MKLQKLELRSTFKDRITKTTFITIVYSNVIDTASPCTSSTNNHIYLGLKCGNFINTSFSDKCFSVMWLYEFKPDSPEYD